MLRMSSTQSAKNLSLLLNVAENAKIGIDGSNCENGTVEKLPRSKNLNWAGYLIPKARSAFTQLRKAFIEAPILRHFNLECHIGIETDASGYPIARVLSQLTFDNLGQ